VCELAATAIAVAARLALHARSRAFDPSSCRTYAGQSRFPSVISVCTSRCRFREREACQSRRRRHRRGFNGSPLRYL